jgi:hypothetical protein
VLSNTRVQCCCTPQIQANLAGGEAQASSEVRLKEESEVKWGGLLGVVALTTNQPYFSSVIATGELRLARPPQCRVASRLRI